MDFPERFRNIEENKRDSWNDDIEDFLGKPQSLVQNHVSAEFDNAALGSSLEEVVLDLEKRLKESFRNWEVDQCSKNIRCAIRTGKNILRWYIQIYLEQLRIQRQRQKKQGECKIDVLRSPETLGIVFQSLKRATEDRRNLKLAHDASLYIFYATFSHFPSDNHASKAIEYLVSSLEFPKECLDILMKTSTVPLALTVVRNLHSMTVSSSTARKSILDSKIWYDPLTTTQSALWAPRESTTIDFTQSCLILMRWSIDVNPSFPSDDFEDKRAELVVEILNCFYAMRKGQLLTYPTSEDTKTNENISLEFSIVKILQLSFSTGGIAEKADETKLKRIEQIQLSAVSLLMDSDVSFGKLLIQNGCFETLLKIFECRVDDTVDNTKIDSTATASLVPILVVLNRYCGANPVAQQKVKSFVFPKDAEMKFQQFLKQKKKSEMRPLDAPKDTLRGKLIALLSWVDGYIKRCSAELMWTLCNSDSSEFTFRVGLGNALPLLNSKGLSPIPIPS